MSLFPLGEYFLIAKNVSVVSSLNKKVSPVPPAPKGRMYLKYFFYRTL